VTVVMDWLTAHLREEEGQGLAEYALILALIAVIAIAALVFLGTQISSILSSLTMPALSGAGIVVSGLAGCRTPRGPHPSARTSHQAPCASPIRSCAHPSYQS
jgi:pilus assembly protein Flp/PilA